jgi:hypothetical protein
MDFPSEIELKKRFHALRADLDKAFAAIKPIQDNYDKVASKYLPSHPAFRKAREEKLAAEKPINEIQLEMGRICRYLGGKTSLGD